MPRDGKALRRDSVRKACPSSGFPEDSEKAARDCIAWMLKSSAKCLQNSTTLKEADVQLNLEKKLAESLGRAIRYHLRRFFNSIYGK
jgi:hypothetical protein